MQQGSGSISYGAEPGGAAAAGVYSAGSARAINSTISGNAAVGGAGGVGDSKYDTAAAGEHIAGGAGGNAAGAIMAIQGIQVYDTTIAGNLAAGGVGGAGSGSAPSGAAGVAAGGLFDTLAQITLDDTIVSSNLVNGVFNDIVGIAASSSGYNIVGVGGGLKNGSNGNQVGTTNPKLGALANNGGPTLTMLPMTGSTAIDKGSNAVIPAGVTTDQRGYARIVNKTVDIGAIEV